MFIPASLTKYVINSVDVPAEEREKKISRKKTLNN